MHKFVGTCFAIVIGWGNMTARADIVTINSPDKIVLDEGEATGVEFGVYTTQGDQFYSGYYHLNLSGPASYTGSSTTGNVGGAITTYSTQSGMLKYYQDGYYQTSVSGNITVLNSNGSYDSGSSGPFYNQNPRTITVRNVAPTITGFTVNGATVGSVPYVNVYEGQSVTANMTATDPGLYDDLRFVVNIDGASEVTLGTDYDPDSLGNRQIGGFVGDFTQSGPGYETFELRGGVYDDDTVTWGNTTIDIRVHNLNPVIDFISSSATIEVGDLFSFGASAHDPGDDPLQYRWDLDGDGYYDDFVGTGMTGLFDLGSYQLRLQVADGDGGYAYSGLTLNVVEPLPEAAVPEPSTFAGLLGIVSVSLIGCVWRRKRQQAA